jgi:hypothetical protein
VPRSKLLASNVIGVDFKYLAIARAMFDADHIIPAITLGVSANAYPDGTGSLQVWVRDVEATVSALSLLADVLESMTGDSWVLDVNKAPKLQSAVVTPAQLYTACSHVESAIHHARWMPRLGRDGATLITLLPTLRQMMSAPRHVEVMDRDTLWRAHGWPGETFTSYDHTYRLISILERNLQTILNACNCTIVNPATACNEYALPRPLRALIGRCAERICVSARTYARQILWSVNTGNDAMALDLHSHPPKQAAQEATHFVKTYQDLVNHSGVAVDVTLVTGWGKHSDGNGFLKSVIRKHMTKMGYVCMNHRHNKGALVVMVRPAYS